MERTEAWLWYGDLAGKARVEYSSTMFMAVGELGRWRLQRVAAGAVLAFAISGWAGSVAAAAPPETSPPSEAATPAGGSDARQSANTIGALQAGIGLLALPAAEVCPHEAARCEPGESSIGIGLSNIGRIGDFAFGAGITWAFGLRPSGSVVDPSHEESLGRQHRRSYFMVEGLFRYYLPGLHAWQWWLGATAGGVIVNDSWSTLADREPYSDTAFVGPRAVTLSTEGLALGLAAGGHWHFADRWLFGVQLRYANWLLPNQREKTPTGDSASLAGRIDVIDIGLVVGYQLPI